MANKMIAQNAHTPTPNAQHEREYLEHAVALPKQML